MIMVFLGAHLFCYMSAAFLQLLLKSKKVITWNREMEPNSSKQLKQEEPGGADTHKFITLMETIAATIGLS